MFQESLAEETAEHLRTHIGGFLSTIASRSSGSDKLTLKVPTVDTATMVGGAMAVDIEEMPIIGVDCVDKQEIPSGESLVYYQYDGAIAGMVSASSARDVDRLVKRYAAAVELYVREHQYLHQLSTDDYSLREFIYVKTDFSGAIEIQGESEKPLWVDGFIHSVVWVTSEDAYRQH